MQGKLHAVTFTRQLNPLSSFANLDYPRQRKVTAGNIRNQTLHALLIAGLDPHRGIDAEPRVRLALHRFTGIQLELGFGRRQPFLFCIVRNIFYFRWSEKSGSNMQTTPQTSSLKSLAASFLQVNPRLLIGITVVLSLILTLYAAVEIHSTRKEFSHLLQEEAHSLLSLTRKGLMDAAVSLEYVEQILTDRLFDNARYLEKLDYEKRLTPATLQELSAMNQLFRINVFDRNGAMVLSNLAEAGRGGGGGGGGPRMQLQPVLRGEADEMILGLRQGRFGSSQRFAVAKARRRGGAITVNVDAQEMLAIRQTIGAGRFIRYLDSIPDIR